MQSNTFKTECMLSASYKRITTPNFKSHIQSTKHSKLNETLTSTPMHLRVLQPHLHRGRSSVQSPKSAHFCNEISFMGRKRTGQRKTGFTVEEPVVLCRQDLEVANRALERGRPPNKDNRCSCNVKRAAGRRGQCHLGSAAQEGQRTPNFRHGRPEPYFHAPQLSHLRPSSERHRPHLNTPTRTVSLASFTHIHNPSPFLAPSGLQLRHPFQTCGLGRTSTPLLSRYALEALLGCVKGKCRLVGHQCPGSWSCLQCNLSLGVKFVVFRGVFTVCLSFPGGLFYFALVGRAVVKTSGFFSFSFFFFVFFSGWRMELDLRVWRRRNAAIEGRDI